MAVDGVDRGDVVTANQTRVGDHGSTAHLHVIIHAVQRDAILRGGLFCDARNLVAFETIVLEEVHGEVGADVQSLDRQFPLHEFTHDEGHDLIVMKKVYDVIGFMQRKVGKKTLAEGKKIEFTLWAVTDLQFVFHRRPVVQFQVSVANKAPGLKILIGPTVNFDQSVISESAKDEKWDKKFVIQWKNW